MFRIDRGEKPRFSSISCLAKTNKLLNPEPVEDFGEVATSWKASSDPCRARRQPRGCPYLLLVSVERGTRTRCRLRAACQGNCYGTNVKNIGKTLVA